STRSTVCGPPRRARILGATSSSRSTTEALPRVSRDPTPDRSTLLAVLGRSQELGFLGPGPVDGQLRHAEGFAAHVPEAGHVVDLGSGGGIPGLVVASMLPGTTW